MAARGRLPVDEGATLARDPDARAAQLRIVRQSGSHRTLRAPGRPTVVFAFHDRQTIRPRTVRDILCRQVGLEAEQARRLLS
jgi:predicted RNA binding protein YcfA (HicA-like mRNA interferase family)